MLSNIRLRSLAGVFLFYMKVGWQMSFLDMFRKTETRAMTNAAKSFELQNNSYAVYQGNIFTAGVINEEAIMKIPTAKSCLNIMTGTIGSLPIYLYKEHKDGSIESFKHDERVRFLNEQPNAYAKGQNLKKQMVRDFVLHGNTYVIADTIVTSDGKLKLDELTPVEANRIRIARYVNTKTGKLSRALVHVLINETGKEVQYQPFELIIATDSADGLTGHGVLEHGQDIFNKAIVEMKHSTNFFERAGIPQGILQVAGRLNAEQLKYTEEAFANKYGGFQNAGKIPILQEGMQYQELQSKVLDLINERNSINEEICKLFGVPINKIIPKNGASGRSLEQDNKAFLQDCLNPIIFALEEAINYTLLTEKEKQDGYYFRFDTSEMLRASEKERTETIVLGLNSGLFTLNEARAKLDLPKHAKDYTAFAPGTTMIDVATGQLVGQGLNQPATQANGSGDVSNEVDNNE